MRSTTRSADAPAGPGRAVVAAVLPWMLVIGGVVGMVASFVLTVEKFELATDPAYVPSCSINPVLNCGSVMDTPQASAFGFPNSLLGIAGFAVVAATGAALLAGAQLGRWYWLGLQVGVTAGAVFVHWLIAQSLFDIGALCPYCMIVWAVTIPLFWYVTLANLDRWYGPRDHPQAVTVLLANHTVPVTIWALTVAGLIAHRFWSYWSGLL